MYFPEITCFCQSCSWLTLIHSGIFHSQPKGKRGSHHDSPGYRTNMMAISVHLAHGFQLNYSLSLWTPIPTVCYCHVRFLCILLINLHEVRGIYLSIFFLTLKLNSPLNKTTAMTEKERGNEEKRSFYLWMAWKGPSCLTLSYYTL